MTNNKPDEILKCTTKLKFSVKFECQWWFNKHKAGTQYKLEHLWKKDRLHPIYGHENMIKSKLHLHMLQGQTTS